MSEWTIGTLKEHVERILEEKERATQIAKGEVDRRLDEMNELRRQIETERGQFVTRELYDERHAELENKVEIQRENLSGYGARLSRMEGGTQVKASTIGLGLTGLGVFLGVVVVVVNLLTGS